MTASRTSAARSSAAPTSDVAVHALGAGISQGTSKAGTSGAPISRPSSCRSRGSGRRGAPRSRSTHTLCAIREHHVDSDARPAS